MVKIYPVYPNYSRIYLDSEVVSARVGASGPLFRRRLNSFFFDLSLTIVASPLPRVYRHFLSMAGIHAVKSTGGEVVPMAHPVLEGAIVVLYHCRLP